MVFLERLSLFNIEHFRKLYNKGKDSYVCDKNFFEIYDEEPFLIKYFIRKQIKLFKVNNEYIGYIWHEYPFRRGINSIYAIYLKDEYIDILNSKILCFFKNITFRYDVLANPKIVSIMKKLNFNINSKNILMKIKTNMFNNILLDNKARFKHFVEGQDEELRCKIQNSVFDNKNRIPLTAEDVYREEVEEYYINNFGVFICTDIGQVVGYGQIINNDGFYTIVNLGILGKYRKQGYGELLIKYLLNLCYKKAIKDVYIRVDKYNYKAISLYKKIGFREYQAFISWYKNIN